MDWVRELNRAPIEPKSVRRYRIYEPEDGWPQEAMEMMVEMLKRGYEFTLVPRQ